MPQQLILPINKCKLTASYKTDAYKNKFGFTHYGADMISTEGVAVLYASGDGEVVATGADSVVGNVVAVKYTQAMNRVTGKTQDVIFRYFHLAAIAVKKGGKVNKDTCLGTYGNTGSLSMAAHLHLEADTDAANPLYSPTVKSASFLKGTALGANDKSMSNPLEWLYTKASAPDYQVWATANDAYIRVEDKNLPDVSEQAKPFEATSWEGIDVSAHNGAVDFKKVAAAGKSFVMIRLGWAGWDGAIKNNGGLDKLFHNNMKAAIAAGLNVGVYVYSYCKTPEAAQIAARETLELVKPYKLTYPVAFDIEDVSDSGVRYDKMSKAYNSAIANAFLSVIRGAGYYGMLYTYKSFAESYLDMTALAGWDVWIAQYAKECTHKGDYGMWQYNGDIAGFTGSCAGVTGACDLNISYKDYASITGAGGVNGEGTEMSAEITAIKAENERLREKNAALKRDIVELNARISALESKE